ncbi:MAG: OmpA family protein [Helicobacteraceae bacterium]|jgi:peptidoglycan-associated lipoprotein|nr:OmpA family protein [Helicobacteraceae bacterium]
MKKLIFTSVLAAALAALTGCGDKLAVEPSNQQAADEALDKAAEVNSETAIEETAYGGDKLPVIYFDFDKYEIHADQIEAIDAIGHAIVHYGSGTFTVEGNCDEWGTDEYNYALGLRRAKSIRDALIKTGVGADRLALVSYGESNSACTQSDSNCWRQNRRVETNGELIGLAPPPADEESEDESESDIAAVTALADTIESDKIQNIVSENIQHSATTQIGIPNDWNSVWFTSVWPDLTDYTVTGDSPVTPDSNDGSYKLWNKIIASGNTYCDYLGDEGIDKLGFDHPVGYQIGGDAAVDFDLFGRYSKIEDGDSYAYWGYWYYADEGLEYEHQVWIAGDQTPSSDILKLANENKSYTYNGQAIGGIGSTDNDAILLDSDNAVKLNINFGAHSLDGSIKFNTQKGTSWEAAIGNGSVTATSYSSTDISGTVSGNATKGTVTIESGEVKGVYFGANAAATGGYFFLDGQDYGTASGVFKAKR